MCCRQFSKDFMHDISLCNMTISLAVPGPNTNHIAQ